MKRIYMLIAGVTFTLCGYSQTTRPELEKQIHDPKRKENAGKADVIIADKKTIFDSTTFNNNTADANNDQAVKPSSKKKHCVNKTKRSSKGTSKKKAYTVKQFRPLKQPVSF